MLNFVTRETHTHAHAHTANVWMKVFRTIVEKNDCWKKIGFYEM